MSLIFKNNPESMTESIVYIEVKMAGPSSLFLEIMNNLEYLKQGKDLALSFGIITDNSVFLYSNHASKRK